MPSSYLAFQLTIILMLVLILILLFLVFHKTRKVHMATYSIVEGVGIARRESELLFSRFRTTLYLEKILGLEKPLPPIRGWTGSPDFLLTVTDAVISRKPTTVLECGSGVSTLVIARCLQLNAAGHLYSLEHESKYAQRTVELLKEYELSNWATVVHSPLIAIKGETPWYDQSVIPPHINQIELLVVDGPPSTIAPLARLPALPRLLPKLADSATVILDDAARKDEIEIVKRWSEYAPDFHSTFFDHEKGCVVLEREPPRVVEEWSQQAEG